MALVCGVAWGFIERLIPYFSLGLLLAPAAGLAIGEVTGLAVNRKRDGVWLSLLALQWSFAI